VYFRPVATLILIAIAAVFCFRQTSEGKTAPPRIIIKLPEKLPLESVWIRYSLNHHGTAGERMHLEDGSREYVIVGSPDIASQHAQIVLYTPGCEFKTYEFDLHPGSDQEERFQCDSLPAKTLHGFIPPNEIPRAIYHALEKRLDIEADLENDWTCDYFLRPQPTRGLISGSCLGSFVPLGMVGTLDPADSGRFEIKIPDFTRDPAFKLTREWGTNFGNIALVLRDKRVGQQVGLMKPKESQTERKDLNVQAEYPDTIIFTTAR
jgi:hypothetical protein